MKKLEDYLHQNAQLYPDKLAAVCNGCSITYSELEKQVAARAATLPQGQIIPFRASQTIDFLVTYYAIHEAGSVAVPLERNTPQELFDDISARLKANTVPEGTADILYTTGTTGKSKGVIISHRTILADAENLIEGQLFSHDLLFIINGPLNHIGSLSKLYPVMMLGATLYILEGMRDVNLFFEALDYPAHKVATFFVPASARILIQFSQERLASYADKIDFIECGGAPLAHADMLTLCRLLPKTRLYNTYASTETGIISTYDYNDGRCMAGCLGRPMSHSRIIITPEGKISCQGDTLMSGYVGEPELTATVLRGDTVYMSDLGRLDEEGMLHIGGRQDDIINVGGYKVSPVEVEDAAMSLPEIKDCICISAEHKIMGSALKLLVVLAEGAVLNKRSIALHLKSKLEPYKVPLLYEQVDAVKRTYNGKIDRKYYKESI
jgi:acyl-coenzyme A synthetase/AMP-(fatty) acid ligase